MKKTVSLVVLISMSGLASAGRMENSAVSADLTNPDLAAVQAIAVPAPVMEKAASSQAWIKAVKKEYERLTENGLGGIAELPGAKMSELPDAAKKQLKQDNHNYGPDYPSSAYKMEVQGKTVFIIQNENDGGMFVNIFDENGKNIAGGSAGESTPFYWGDEKSV